MSVKEDLKVEKHPFADDGNFPNSKYPLVVYHNAFAGSGDKAADWLEQKFASNQWSNAWRWGVYDFHHYHSNTHEVLGVFKGWASLQLGGPNGKRIKVESGDIIVIPAGVAHKCMDSGEGFEVVGAYLNGLKPDMNKGEDGERPQADQNISAVPFHAKDPLLGEQAGITSLWSDSD